MNIDIRTFVLVLGVIAILQVVAIYLQYLMNKTYRGAGWWLLWSASTAAGFLCMLSRDFLRAELVLISIFFANVLLLAGQSFLYIGVVRFIGGRVKRLIIEPLAKPPSGVFFRSDGG